MQRVTLCSASEIVSLGVSYIYWMRIFAKASHASVPAIKVRDTAVINSSPPPHSVAA